MSKVWYRLKGKNVDMLFSHYKTMSVYWSKLPLEQAITCTWDVIEEG